MTAGVAGAIEPARSSLRKTLALFFGSRPLVVISLSSSLGAFVCYGMMAWISAYLQRVLGMSLKEAAVRFVLANQQVSSAIIGFGEPEQIVETVGYLKAVHSPPPTTQ